MPVVISVVFFIIFHVLNITGEKMVREGVLNPTEGMWMSAVILFPIGLILTMKATSDSKIFDTEAYKKFILKISWP